MRIERRGRKVLQKKARELVNKVFSYFKREADAGMSIHEATKAQERNAEPCDTSIRNLQRIISEGNLAIFLSPRVTSLR
jgi:hypothetical protein